MVDVPIIDAAGWARAAAARANARAVQSSAAATILDVEKQVARNYYQLIGAAALRAAAERTLEAARQNLDLTGERHSGGIATELDVHRAASEVERARQSISDAELTFELSRRALRTLAGITPEGEVSMTSDDLHEEAPLESLVSVRERTREIGVRRAVGATRNTILMQFLVEAVVIASLGGLVGLGLGAGIIGLARLAVPGLPVQLSPWIVFTALGFAGAVGVLSGVIPARSAAQLDPVEALRYE